MSQNTNRTTEDQRIEMGLYRGPQLNVEINGKPVCAFAGETIATVMTAARMRTIRRSSRRGEPRGLYCGMGICHECLITVNGQPNVRACVARIEPEQQITTQDGLGRFDTKPPELPKTALVRHQVPLAIVGGGAAGLSAACAAARAGTQVLVINSEPELGGHIFRQFSNTSEIRDPPHLDEDYATGQSLLHQIHQLKDRITVWNNACVWSVFEPRQLAVARGDELILLDAEAIVVATGSYDRPVPVPGWTLPGVITTGAAQLLLKSQRVRPGQRVLLAGSGALQLVVANQLLDAGVEVIAVAEATTTRRAWRHLPHLLRQPALLARGRRYLSRLKKAGIRVLEGHSLQAIHGSESVEQATLTKVDPQWNPISAETRTFEVDTVCLGYGFIPQTALTRMLGCAHHYDPLVGGWVPRIDPQMQTDQPGVFAAGDCAGVAGVLVAVEEGSLAGVFAAEQIGTLSADQAGRRAAPLWRRLKSLRRFCLAMDMMYQIQPGLYAHVSDPTVVCRCEEVTASAIRHAASHGTADLNDIKKRTRAGMGYCQGANCIPPIAAILHREFDIEPQTIDAMTIRPPVRPIPLKLLMVNEKT